MTRRVLIRKTWALAPMWAVTVSLHARPRFPWTVTLTHTAADGTTTGSSRVMPTRSAAMRYVRRLHGSRATLTQDSAST